MKNKIFIQKNKIFINQHKIGIMLVLNVVGFLLPGYAADLDEVMRNLIYPAQVSYQGEETIVFWSTKGEKITTRMRIYFKPNKLRIEYLSPPGMQSTVLLDDGEYMYSCDTESHKALRFKESSFKVMHDNKTIQAELKFSLLKKNYEPAYLKETEISGQPAYIILIKPLNPANPPREITVDGKHNTILEEKIFNVSRELIYNSFFTQILFSEELPDTLFTPSPNTKIIEVENQTEEEANSQSFQDIQEAIKHTNFKFRLPGYIPTGYVFEKVVILSENNKKYIQLQYHDGLNSISLFETLFNISISKQFNLELSETKLVEGEVVKVFYHIPSNLIYKKLNYMNCFIISNLSKEELYKMLLSIK